jgi:IclR family transcriptional regulator, KDG regulon repressor
MPEPERGSRAIHRALSILRAFTSERPTLSLTEIARDAKLTMPTAHRMAKALQAEDFLVQEETSGAYMLGPAVMSMAQVILERNDEPGILLTALPVMEELRELSGETVCLFRPAGTQRVCIAEMPSRQLIRVMPGVGQSLPMCASAAGRVMLAAMPEDARERILDDCCSDGPRPVTPKRCREEVAKGVRQGYVIMFDDTVKGASAMAVALRDASGRVAAAISVTGPSDRFTRKRVDEQLPHLLDAAKRIEGQLGTGRQAAA